jgi:ATP-dependent Clp protease ATP-binding subunit ClpX
LQDARLIEQLEEALEQSQQAAHAFKKAEALRDKSRTLQNEAQQSRNHADAEVDEGLEKKAADIVYRSPAAILDDLNKVVVGQMATKRGLANAASQHLRRILLSPEDRANTDKANVLIVGPTGCGKTLLTQALSQAMNVPFYRTEATKLTASGYVGEDVHSVLAGLLRSCDWNVERAQHGIIYIDEIDKVTAHDTNGQFDVRGKAVQEELLTILEGTKVTVTKDGKRTGEPVEIDTTNILFIVGGAFSGLGELIRQRLSANDSTIGFGAALRKKQADASSYVKYATAEDFVSFGLIPEFVGRLPKRLSVTTLTVVELKRILLEPKKALLQQKRLLLAPTTDLRFSESALTAIAEEAHKTGTNGRALLEIVEQVLDPIIFAEPASVVVTAAMVLNRSAEISACQQESTPGIAPLSFDFIVADDQATDQIAAEKAPAAAATTRRVGVLLTKPKS